MWSWLLPFGNNSYRSSKDKEAIVRDLRTKVHLYRHWLPAFFDGPGDQLVWDFRDGVFTITQKRIVGTQSYFPVVRLVVQDARSRWRNCGSSVQLSGHATVAAPFLEPNITTVEVSGSRSQTRPYVESPAQGKGQTQRRLTSGQDFTWPMAPGLDGKTIDLRAIPARILE